MTTVFVRAEARFNAWAGLDPLMSPNERQYLGAHAYCALGEVAAQLQRLTVQGDEATVANMRGRNYVATDLEDFMDPAMPLAEFMRGSIKMSQSWMHELAKKRPNRRQFAYAARQLFKGNDAGWERYVVHIRKSAPWFDQRSLDDDDDFRPRGGRLAMVVHGLLAG